MRHVVMEPQKLKSLLKTEKNLEDPLILIVQTESLLKFEDKTTFAIYIYCGKTDES